MAKNQELSTNEKLVLYGLVRFPEEHAIEVAKKMGIPQPTFSNVVKRLDRKNYLSTVGLPGLEYLGLELIGVLYGSYNPTSTDKDRREIELNLRQRYPEIFFMVSGVHQVLMFLASNDFTELSKVLDDIEKTYIERGIIERTAVSTATFALKDTLIARWFDYSLPLFNKFKLDQKGIPPPMRIRTIEHGAVKLLDHHQNELRVLLYLLENPMVSDVKMAKALELSRTTVSKIKAKLISQGLFMRCVIPNISKMGFEVFVFSDVEFKAETTYQQRIGSTEWLLGKLPIVVSMISNKRALTLYAFENYHDFQELKRLALSEYVGKGYIQGEIKTIIYSSSEMIAQPEPNFIPILRKVLKLP
jgi:DNA-binding MarR family transcriptional regulator